MPAQKKPTAHHIDKLNSYERDDKETTIIRAWLKEKRKELVRELATKDVPLKGGDDEATARKVLADTLSANPDKESEKHQSALLLRRSLRGWITGRPAGWGPTVGLRARRAAVSRRSADGRYLDTGTECFWCKPGRRFNEWDDAEEWASTYGLARAVQMQSDGDVPPTSGSGPGTAASATECRLLTHQEMTMLCDQVGPLFPEDNQWACITSDETEDGKDWVAVGDYNHVLVESHVSNYGVPDWSLSDNWTFQDKNNGNKPTKSKWTKPIVWTTAEREKQRLAMHEEEELLSQIDAEQRAAMHDEEDINKLKAKTVRCPACAPQHSFTAPREPAF